VFYGWVIVACGFVAQMITGVSNQALSVYVVPLQDEFSWSRAHIGLARSLTQAENALLGPVNGWMVDRFGPRFNMTAGVALFGLGLFSLGLVQSLWMFYAANVLMAVGAGMGSLIVISTAINNWFIRRRTLGIAIATTGLAFSGAVVVPLIVLGEVHLGWRGAAFATAAGVWLIGLPAALLMRQAPELYGLLPDGDRPGDQRREGPSDPSAKPCTPAPSGSSASATPSPCSACPRSSSTSSRTWRPAWASTGALPLS
jgi:MFS family permease